MLNLLSCYNQDEFVNQHKSVKRRQDIDILIISVTWLILVYHAVAIYCAYVPYYVKDPNIPPYPGFESPSFYALVYMIFMNAWNMPFFFFLSGISSYLSLGRYQNSMLILFRLFGHYTNTF